MRPLKSRSTGCIAAFTLIIAATLVWCAYARDPQKNAAADLVLQPALVQEKLIAFFEEVEKSQEGLELFFQDETYFGKGANTPPDQLTDDHFVWASETRCLRSKERYRIEWRIRKAGKEMVGGDDWLSLSTWDGEQSRGFTTGLSHAPTDQQQRGGIHQEPPQAVAMYNPCTMWGAWWVYYGRYSLGFKDLVEREMLDMKEVGEHRFICRFPSEEWSNNDYLFEVELNDGQLRLISATSRLFESPEAFEAQNIDRLSGHWQIQYSGELCENFRLPCTATIIQRHFGPNCWGMIRLRLTDARRVACDDRTFREPFADDAIVSDERYGIAYTLGARSINMDGRLFEANEPLHGEVGENLVWWLQNGRFLTE